MIFKPIKDRKRSTASQPAEPATPKVNPVQKRAEPVVAQETTTEPTRTKTSAAKKTTTTSKRKDKTARGKT